MHISNLLLERIPHIKSPGKRQYGYKITMDQVIPVSKYDDPFELFKVKVPIHFFSSAERLVKNLKKFNPVLNEISLDVSSGCVDKEKENEDGFFYPLLMMKVLKGHQVSTNIVLMF